MSINFRYVDVKAPLVLDEADKNDLDIALGFTARAWNRAKGAPKQREACDAAYTAIRALIRDDATIGMIGDAVVATRTALCVANREAVVNQLMVVTARLLAVQDRHYR